MSKIDHIEAVADRLNESSIAILPKRCTYIRNWNSKCRNCLAACPHDAIERSLGHLSIDPDKCTNCGTCVTACPTGTFVTTKPDPSRIVSQARTSARVNGGNAIFICEPHALRVNIDRSRVVVLPCLDYLDEYLILGMFACDIKAVTLLYCGCKGCKIGSKEPLVEGTVASTLNVMKHWGIDKTLRLTDHIPDVLISEDDRGAYISGTGRREAFWQAGSTIASFVSQAARTEVDELTGNKPDPTKQNKPLVVKMDDVDPPDTYRSVRMKNMLDRLGTRPYGGTVESRFWASVAIDPERCRYCGACAKLCVTRALKFHENEEDNTVSLTFEPALCMACRLCKDTCLTHSMVYSNQVMADDLDDDVVKYLFKDHEKPKRRWGLNR